MATKKGEITADTISTWQTTGGKDGGKIVGGVSLPSRYTKWHNERYTPEVTPEEVENNPHWRLKYPQKPGRGARKVKGKGRGKSQPADDLAMIADPDERALLRSWRGLPEARKGPVVESLAEEARAYAGQKAIEDQIAVLAKLSPEVAEAARKALAKAAKAS